jgi:hypothetical protein
MPVGFSRELVEALGDDWEKVSELNEALKRLDGMKRQFIEIEGLLLRSKQAWKVAVLQQVFIRRAVMLAQGCAEMWNAGNILGATLCARSLMETGAVFLDVRDQLRRLIDRGDIPGIDALVTSRTFGTKLEAWLTNPRDQPAINVMTMIAKLDKGVNGFSHHYALLSEFCHPNYLGHLGLFADLDTTTGRVEFSDSKSMTVETFNMVFMPFLLVALVENAAEAMDAMLPQLVEVHEAYISANKDT